ncbi:hypothetical protein NPX13_g7757 [Xylaria arbuscula]|uniref:Heterokaryon incompatibility domain-containing protein n=1 Tax=Xylaria arbuscula TaxID=114810 RepID=A0A9W8TJ75_9PEZI|nr:hypothetical protein NPX13_g7757 [Xylaria arbuscula]
MRSTDSTDSATTSRPYGHPNRGRCPDNLCAHVSFPSFNNASEEVDVDTLLHSSCNNCPSQAEQETLCNFCRHLRLRHLAICLRDKLTGLYIELDHDSNTRGSGISRILLNKRNKKCDLCGLLANTILSYFVMTKKHEEDETSMQAETSVSLWLRQGHGTGRLFLRLRGPNRTDEIEITYREPSKDSITTVGSLIYWPTVQQWINKCADHDECKRLAPLTMPEGFRLIDVENWNLVSDFPPGSKLGDTRIKFVALSYVWGKQDTSRNDALLACNKDELTTPGGLRNIISLPKAIKDAITICQQLDYRFLWVDRFCIQQDDGPNKQTQINAMGDIYSSAALTIIHASGASFEDPIAGVTIEREALQSKTITCGLELISGYLDIEVVIKASNWGKRGWTYQEAILSRRKLFFTPFELWFECSYGYAPYQREEQCSRRRQGSLVGDWDRSRMTQFGLDNFVESETQFEDFVRHLESYTARSLTYQSDILNAFIGILTTLYKTKLGIYGLPETDFDQALLWYCKTEQMPKMDSSFPSWSWASVSEIVTAPIIRFQQGFLGPLVQWWYKDRNRELKIVRSKNSLHCRDTRGTKGTRDKPDTNAQAHLLVAWWKGCIEPAIPEDVKQALEKCSPACESSTQTQLPFIERVWGHIKKAEKCTTCESKIAERWPDLEEVWKSIKGARNLGIWDTQYFAEQLLIEELQPGVLLTRAQTAYFKISLEVDARWDPFSIRLEIYFVDSGGRRIGIIRPEYTCDTCMTGITLHEVLGIKAGTAQTDSLECMSVSLSSIRKLEASESTTLDSDLELKMARELGEIVNKMNKKGEPLPGEKLLSEDLTGVRQSAVNVLIIHREGGSKGCPIARRIGVGWIYLEDWMKADRAFQTIGLK